MSKRVFYPVTSIHYMEDKQDGYVVGILNSISGTRRVNKMKDVTTGKIYDIEFMPNYLFMHDFTSAEGKRVSRNIFAGAEVLSIQQITTLKNLLVKERNSFLASEKRRQEEALRMAEEREKYKLTDAERNF